jgi:signal transduction histidine kinase
VRRLTAVEKLLLATLLPVFAASFALHVESLVTIGLAQPPVWIEPPAASAYPRVGGYLVETGRGGAELERGDRLLRIGSRDLRGLGPLHFRAAAMQQAGLARAADVVYERGGERRATRLAFVSPRLPWAKTPALLIAVVTSVLLLRRASNVRFARLLFVSLSMLAVGQLAWYGPRDLQTFLYWSYFMFGTALAAPLLLRAAMAFPDDGAIPRRTANAVCVAVGLAYLVVRASALVTWLLPPRHVASLILAVDSAYVACILAALTWNYRHADARGRRQIRWVTLGAYVPLLPLAATLLATAIDPDFAWFDELLAIAAVSAVGIPLSFWVAVARTNLFDIDRLIGATASYGIVLVLVVAGLVSVVQGASEPVGHVLGLPGGVAQIVLAGALAAAAIPLGGRLRRRVDAFFFPERRALELGAERLRGRLSACGDPRTLFSLLGAEISAILRPVRCVLYVRAGGGFSPAFASGAAADEDFAPPESLQDLPLLLDDGAGVLAPIRRVGELAAVLALGAKRSGDVYTATDLALLGSITERASSELLRFQHEQVVAETERMISGLRDEKDAADRASRAKTLFLATASHDLRQPLHALGLFAEALAERPLDDESRSLVGKIGSPT